MIICEISVWSFHFQLLKKKKKTPMQAEPKESCFAIYADILVS